MRVRGERGTALVEFCWLAILLLVPLVYVVLATFDVQRAAFAAADAARVAGRAYLTAPDQVTARARAQAAARLAFTDQGIAEPPTVTIVCDPQPHACLTPGSVVTVYVASSVALPLLPSSLGSHRPGVRVSSQHSAPYGEFREARP